MIERVHQTIGNMIRTMDLIGLRKPSEDEDEDKLSTTRDKWEGLLSAVAFAVWSTVHTTMRATPMQLVFGRDAILNVGFQADWDYINARRTKVILQNNRRGNLSVSPTHTK